MALIGHGHIAGEELGVHTALAQTGQIDVAFCGAVPQPALAAELFADGVAVAVDDEGVKMEGVAHRCCFRGIKRNETTHL